jgi:hypothetical protein
LSCYHDNMLLKLFPMKTDKHAGMMTEQKPCKTCRHVDWNAAVPGWF